MASNILCIPLNNPSLKYIYILFDLIFMLAELTLGCKSNMLVVAWFWSLVWLLLVVAAVVVVAVGAIVVAVAASASLVSVFGDLSGVLVIATFTLSAFGLLDLPTFEKCLEPCSVDFVGGVLRCSLAVVSAPARIIGWKPLGLGL